MGLFSDWFKPKPQKTFASSLGSFKLSSSKDRRHLWSAQKGDVHMSVLGSQDEPYQAHLKFLERVDREIQKLDTQITAKFIETFTEAELPIDFKHWKERFKLSSVDVIAIKENLNHWGITFEELKEPYAHYNLFIEGQTLIDFSIDT
jgi:hypothetical protein